MIDLKKLNKTAKEYLGDDYRVSIYKGDYLLYELGNILYQTYDGLAMMMYIMLLSKRKEKEEKGERKIWKNFIRNIKRRWFDEKIKHAVKGYYLAKKK